MPGELNHITMTETTQTKAESKNFVSTLNLPKTPFPMQAELLSRQEEMLQRWQAADIYKSLLEDRRDARPFIIHDGPPFASGHLHVGIGMNKAIKDMIAKYHSMNDRRVPLVPGWDCHGLPIESQVLMDLGSNAKEASVSTIRLLCAKYALRYVGEQKRLFQLLGIFADWEKPYLTLNSSYEAGVLTVFLDMVEKRYIYRDRKPITWCPSCHTALAEAEVQYPLVSGSSLWILFDGGSDLARICGVSDELRCSLLVWTSSTWSLPGNAAVGVHPDFFYSAFVFKDDTGIDRAVIIQADSAASVFQALGVAQFNQVGTCKGSSLEGVQVKHPVFERQVPVVFADFIQKDSGSGLIHIAPAHGTDDFLIARRYGLPTINLLDEEGRFTQEAGEFAGKNLSEAEGAILDSMRKRASLVAVTEVKHEHPHCWRCANSLITRVTEQWFARVDHRETPDAMTLREKALLEVDIVNWLPATSRQRIRGMIETRPDWCISRQRLWGVPIPAFHCRKCGEAILAPEAIRLVRDLVGVHGSAIWFEKSAAELLPAGFRCPSCGDRRFEKGTDILDVWFEAGTSWQAMLVADHRLNFPADLYIEGSDQHRGWFQLSLLSALASRGMAPFRTVLTHGFVLNEKMHRMNRAGGDLVTLQETLEKVPADIVRLYFASVDTSTDIPLSLKTFESITPQYRTIRNTFRYLLGNLFDFVAKHDSIHLEDLHPIDLWAFCRFHELIHKVSEDYSVYRFHSVVRRIHDFCNEDLSKLYFDILKDRLYCDPASSSVRRSAQTVLHTIVMGLVKLLAPLIPYTCDEVWTLTPGHSDCPSVHLSRWPKADEQFIHTRKSQEAIGTISRWLQLRRAVASALEALREQKIIGNNSEAIVRLNVSDGLDSLLGNATLADLKDFLMVSEVVLETSKQDAIKVEELPGISFHVATSPHTCCARCRRRDSTCGLDSQYPDLCGRCVGVLNLQEKIFLSVPAAEESISPSARPADLAKFLLARDIRRVALLNEAGRCRAYALHASSQEVRHIGELQSLADHIGTSADFRDHAAVLLGLGEHTDAFFGVGIHHLSYGTPLGGTREFSYPRIRDLLDNLLRLSWGMSVKNAVAELPHGGGKSIIDTCGFDLKVHRELRREIYRDFGQFIASLFGRYICAEDVGNTTADTREMLSACRHVMCLSQGVSGSGNPSRFTALAAWAAAKAGWKFLTGKTSFEGLVIALQGAGNVGRNIVSILIEADSKIAKIYIADRDPEQIQLIGNMLLKRGKGGLLEVLSSRDPRDISPSTAAYEERDDEKGKAYVLYAQCDILIPAAVGDVINPGTVPQLNCKLILPIANNVYSDNDTVAAMIYERGIVDVVENNINWGGAMAAASEVFGYDEANVTAACLEAFTKTLNLLEDAKRRECPPWEIVKADAFTRIFRSEHRIVGEARRYKFIGNISQGFTEWIKTKWLRNVVDVEVEEFGRYAVTRAKGTIA